MARNPLTKVGRCPIRQPGCTPPRREALICVGECGIEEGWSWKVEVWTTEEQVFDLIGRCAAVPRWCITSEADKNTGVQPVPLAGSQVKGIRPIT
jgi:hypothetical protein